MFQQLSNFTDRITASKRNAFAFFWLVVFIIYLPTATSGFVSDTTGWFESLERDGFWDYINRTRFGVKSMYQLTQFVTWVFYQLFGRHPWPYHLIHVTMHATNAWFLYLFCSRLFSTSGILKASKVALAGALLFCISPYVTEVVVWEASYHYLQALLFIFGILLLAQRFQTQQSGALAIWGFVLFFLSIFSLELFYLTPVFVLSMAVFYRYALHYDKAVFRKTLLYLSLPQLLIFILHFFSFHYVYGAGMAHLGFQMMKNPLPYFIVKAPWYFFHLFAFGRFWHGGWRSDVYNIFRTAAGAIAFYAALLGLCIFLLVRLRQMTVQGKLIVLFIFWFLCAQALLVPLWFPELLLVVCDRYTYLLLCFQWMMVVLLFARIQKQTLRRVIYLGILGLNLSITVWLVRKWSQSTKIIASIERSAVLKPGKVKILLNSPACLKGIPMIGTSQEGEFRLMHNLFFPPKIADTMLEVAAYNMDNWYDGAHVQVLNDSSLKVSLNTWGTWWWLGGFGAHSYENQWFQLNMADAGHWYIVTFKKERNMYQVLYHSGSQLKEVNWLKKDEQY